MTVLRKVALVIVLTLVTAALTASHAAAQTPGLTVQQCIDIALERNIGVITAKNNFGRARWDLWDAWGDALPNVSASARYGYNKSFGKQYQPDLGIEVEVPGTKSYSTGLSISMTLFDGGATWFNIKRSSLLKTASRNDLRQQILSTIYGVRQAYYALVSAQMLRRVQEDALARSKKQLEVTTSRYELGSASLSEKLKAQVNVANDSLTLLQRVNDIQTAEFNLNVLMNRDVSLPVNPVDTLARVDISRSLDNCIETALNENPSLKSTKASYDAARAGTKISRQSWVPRANMSLNWGWSTRESGEWFSYDYDNGAYSFGINFSYGLFDGFSKKTTYSKAKLSELTARENYEAERNVLIYNVRQAYLDIQKARLQHETAVLAELSAAEDMKLQQERYRLGASSILELLDAQVSLTNAQYSRISALYQLNLAVAAMARAMGQM